MALTPNKNYNNQATGSNVNTWGVVNNSNFSIIDLNLGGRLAANVAGASNFTVTSNQAQNLIHVLTGLLTGNIQYILPALGGIYMVENDSTGNFTITIMCAGGAVGAIIPQGMRAFVVVNPNDTSVKVDLIGSNYSQGLAPSTGSLNAQAVASMIPGPYMLIDGTLSTWVAGFTNSAAMTLALGGTAAKSVKKASSSGYADPLAGDVFLGQRYLSVYDKTNDIHVLINPTLGFNLGALAYLNIGAGLADDGSGNLKIDTHGVVNSMLNQMPANSVKVNATATLANASDLQIPASSVLGRDDSGNLVPLAIGPGLSATSGIISSTAGTTAGSSKNIKIATLGANSVITADEVALESSGNSYFISRGINVTVNTGNAPGLLGIDTGSWAINTWYYLWLISNGTLTSAIASLSSTTPTLPGGYTYKARICAVKSSGTATTLLSTLQYGRTAQYAVTGSAPNAGLPIMASGSAGNINTPVWSGITLSPYVPATASIINGSVYTGAGSAMAAPNNNYGSISSSSNPPPVMCTSGNPNIPFSFTIESTSIYWASNAANFIFCRGWEDNI